MDNKEIGIKLDEVRKVLERIDTNLTRLGAKNTRQWITTYYDAIDKIPDCFSPEQWRETEDVIYGSMVEEINGDFTARGVFHSGMRVKLLEVFKKEREKLLKTKEVEEKKHK